jgi:thiamine-phosphate pyrophosphorylase
MNKTNLSLMYVTDDSITNDANFFEILEAALKGGASCIQLREKTCDTKTFYNRALHTKALCESYHIPLIINDRVDIALAVNADGVHLGQTDLPYKIAREVLGSTKTIGLSVSNITQATKAQAAKEIDYIGVSPIFATQTKTKNLDAPLGISGLVEICEIYKKPIVCIGGILLNNAQKIIKNGATGIAVVSAISKAEDPETATRNLKNKVC